MTAAPQSRTPVDDILLVTLPSTGVPQTILGAVTASVVEYGGSANSHLRALMSLLRVQAGELGADAVVDFHVAVSVTHNAPIVALVATGTAVRLPWPDGHDSPERHAGTDQPAGWPDQG